MSQTKELMMKDQIQPTTSKETFHSKEGVAGQEKTKSSKNPLQTLTGSDYIYLAGVLGIILTLIWYAPQIKADSEKTQTNRQLLADITQKNCMNLTHPTELCNRIFTEIKRQTGEQNGTTRQAP